MNPNIYDALEVVSERDPVSVFISNLLKLQSLLSEEEFDLALNLLYWYYSYSYSQDVLDNIFSAFDFKPDPGLKAERDKLVAKLKELIISAYEAIGKFDREKVEALVEALTTVEFEKGLIALPSLETGTALVLDPKKRLISEVKFTRRGPKVTKVFEGYPVEVRVLYDVLADNTYYEITLSITEPPYRRKISGFFEDVVRKLPYYGQKSKKEAYARVLFRGLLERGIATQGVKDPPYGFSFDKNNGRVIVNMAFDDKYDLKEALELLKVHGEEFYKGLEGQFLVTVVVGLLSPFSFLLRQLQLGVYVPFLYLWGDSGTGKTSLLVAAMHFYPTPDSPHQRKIGPGRLHSSYQLGAYFGAGSPHLKMDDTLPLIINEGATVLEKFQEIFKDYFESTKIRARYDYEIIGLRHPWFTSNYEPPFSQGLERRMIILYFSRQPFTPEEQERYNREIIPQLPKYQAIGRAFMEKFIEVVNKLVEGELSLTQEGLLEVAFDILVELYEDVGVPRPRWLDKNLLYQPQGGRDWGQKLLDALKYELSNAYAKLGRRDKPPREGIEEMIRGNLLPYIIYNPKARGYDTIITTSIYEILRPRGFEHISLERIASLLREKGLSCEVDKVHWGGRYERGVKFYLSDLIDLLFPSEEAFEEEESWGASEGEYEDLRVVIRDEIFRLARKKAIWERPSEFIETVHMNLLKRGYEISKKDIQAELINLAIEGLAMITPDYIQIILRGDIV